MSLRWRLIAFTLVVGTAPAGVLGYLFRERTLEDARVQQAERLDAITESARRRVLERRSAERRAIARLCEGDFVVDRLMLDLQADRFGPLEQDELVQRLPNLMRSMGLESLMLIDGRPGRPSGRVFAAGHFPGRAGADEGATARAVEEAGERWFVRDLHVRREGETHPTQSILTGCVAREGEARVIAVGGHVLDQDYVASLGADVPPVQLFLTDAEGTLPEGVGHGGPREDVHVFEDLRGQPAAMVVASVDDRALQQRLRELDQQLLYGLAIMVIVAFVLGLVIAFFMVRPLVELETAAARVASGDMSTTITIHSGGEVKKALQAFNHMTGELKHAQAKLIRAERIAAWRDIARRIAHEIKNPLMPIQTSIETMRKTHARQHPDFDEIFEESTVTILEEVERLKRIVTEFSRFARMPRPQPVELAVEDVARHTVGLHGGGPVAVELTIEDPLPKVRADREQLTQVLVNLVQNAADAAKARHGESGGRVDVVLSSADVGGDEGVRVEVVDNGPGIPPDEQAKIFEPYYTTKAGGTGLGLAIVHRIVSDHGGSIDVGDAAHEEGGAVFEILLTRRGPPIEASTTQTDAALPLIRKR
ncbi:MAG: ATP-binding protein [Sandaracinaceae bacterium]